MQLCMCELECIQPRKRKKREAARAGSAGIAKRASDHSSCGWRPGMSPRRSRRVRETLRLRVVRERGFEPWQSSRIGVTKDTSQLCRWLYIYGWKRGRSLSRDHLPSLRVMVLVFCINKSHNHQTLQFWVIPALCFWQLIIYSEICLFVSW